MAVSDQAGRALELITGIEVLKQTDEAFWRSAVVRIALEIDEEPGAERLMHRVADLLAKWWKALPDKTEPVANRDGTGTRHAGNHA